MRSLSITLTSMLVLLIGCGETPTPSAAPTATLPRVDRAGIEQLIAQAKAGKQVVVLDFWATWCEPCIAMFPSLHQGLKEIGPGVMPVTISLDAPGKLEAKAVAYLKKQHAMKNAYLLEPDSDAQLAVVEAIGPQWRNLVVPAIFVYAPDGTLVGEHLGSTDADQTVRDVLDQVRQALDDPS